MATPEPEIKATTQDHLEIENIKDNFVVLKTGEVIAVLSTTAVNFALLSEMEQDALISAFAQLLNSIGYPIQIVIRSKRIDISNYLTKVVRVEQGLTDPLLKKQAQSYRKFIQDLIKVNEVLDKRFYVVIPSGKNENQFVELGASPFDWINKLMGSHTKRVSVDVDKAIREAISEIQPKIDHVSSEFNRLGIKAKQLTTQELVELYFEIYNPASMQTQKIRTGIEDYKAAIVEPVTFN